MFKLCIFFDVTNGAEIMFVFLCSQVNSPLRDFNIWFVWFCPAKKQAIALALGAKYHSVSCGSQWCQGCRGLERAWASGGENRCWVLGCLPKIWVFVTRFLYVCCFLKTLRRRIQCSFYYSKQIMRSVVTKRVLNWSSTPIDLCKTEDISLTDAIYQQFLFLSNKKNTKNTTSCWFVLCCFIVRWWPSALARNVTVNHVDFSNVHMSIKGAEAPWTVGFSVPKNRGVVSFWSRFLGKKTGSLNLNMFFFRHPGDDWHPTCTWN